jgi:hypothetical protein
VKPGYKTTEFWLTAAASIVGLVLASGILSVDGEAFRLVGLGAAVLTSLGYSVARAKTKVEEARASDPRRP